MPKFIITALVKTRDIIEAPDVETALNLFTTEYPAMLDKQSKFIGVDRMIGNRVDCCKYELDKKCPVSDDSPNMKPLV